MSPNQRLIIAVLLSIVFFTAYTAIFPPVQPEANKDVQTPTLKTETTPKLNDAPKVEDVAGHAIPADEKVSQETNSIAVVKSKNFILKIDSSWAYCFKRVTSREVSWRQQQTRTAYSCVWG